VAGAIVSQEPFEDEGADDEAGYVEVEASRLDAGTLDRLVEEFVSRDGTDYGSLERSLSEKAADVMKQLESGDVRIVFNLESETVQLVLARELEGD
jgi:uncharacterized protein YheU (UPF0270 family)